MSKARNHPRCPSSPAGVTLSVVNHCRGLRVDRKLLAKAVRLIGREYGINSGQIELAIFGDKEMASLHKKHLGKQTVTDVICFDLAQDEQTKAVQTGQLQVCLALGGEVARKQAKLNKTSINKELALYVVHGLLHVLGYDDTNFDNSERMHQREDELLEQLGVGAVFCKRRS